MYDVVVVGGGWAGCSAAVAAAKMSVKVALVERSDSLLGVGAAGGIYRNQARTTVIEEIIAMGGGELFQAMDRCLLHRDIQGPKQAHLCTYNFFKIGREVEQVVAAAKLDVIFQARVTEVKMQGGRLASVVTAGGEEVSGKVFVDATGTSGPEALCREHGTGCVQCLLRCPTFGPRASLAGLAGVKEGFGLVNEGKVGAMSGGAHIFKESLAPELERKLSQEGFLMVPAPPWEGHSKGLQIPPKYYFGKDGKDMSDYIMGVDIGVMEFMGRPFMALQAIHAVEGFERARYCEPMAGGIGHSMRFLVLTKTDLDFRVPQVENLYCAGEKVGPWVGKTEAVITGMVAGHNAARQVKGAKPLDLPATTAVGCGLRYVAERLDAGETNNRYGFSGGSVFEAVKAKGLYIDDLAQIHKNVGALGLTGIFARS